MNVKTLFVSDVHLGNVYSKKNDFLNFLQSLDHNLDAIYLIGDFIDGWKFQSWNDTENAIIQELLDFSKKGTKIYYVIGNHDDFLNYFVQENSLMNFGNIKISKEEIYENKSGRKILITHGDVFDIVHNYKWLYKTGNFGYKILIKLNHFVNVFRKKIGCKRYFSLSNYVKQKVRKANMFVVNFEKCLTDYAKNRNCDGVICGHIHSAILKEENDFLYGNTGDWIETCSFITEDDNGELELYFYEDW